MSFIRATATSTFRGNLGQFISGRITPGVVDGVTKFTQIVYDESQILVPVDKGDLKASGHVVIEVKDKQVVGHVIYDSEHAAYNEYGTGIAGASSPGAGDVSYNMQWPGMPATPFLRPSLDSARDAGMSAFKGSVAAQMRP